MLLQDGNDQQDRKSIDRGKLEECCSLLSSLYSIQVIDFSLLDSNNRNKKKKAFHGASLKPHFPSHQEVLHLSLGDPLVKLATRHRRHQRGFHWRRKRR